MGYLRSVILRNTLRQVRAVAVCFIAGHIYIKLADCGSFETPLHTSTFELPKPRSNCCMYLIFSLPLTSFIVLQKVQYLRRELDTLLTEWKPPIPNQVLVDEGVDPVRVR